jgi:O-antigen/teichoic acid export membrane protein
VVGMWLEARWIARFLAAPEFFDSFEAVGLLATGVALYALYLALVVILGRTGRTGFNFPATAAGTAVNVALNLALVPPFEIVGAGLALVASYVVVLALMYWFTQRLFFVPYEWGRLARLVVAAAAVVGAGELLLPTTGAAGLVSRALLWLAFPVVLWASGFFTAEERRSLSVLARPRELAARLRLALTAARAAPAGASEAGTIPEVYEAEVRDEDSRS